MEARHDGNSRGAGTQESSGFSSSTQASARAAGKNSRKSRAKKAFPPVDTHLVVPEVTRDEMIRGRKVVAMAALPEHADAQTGLNFLLAAHAARGYIVSTELLTRVSEGSDFATDVCIRKEGIEPETRQRYLEELSFEIVNEQRMRDITDKASELATRGVRRIFAIFVKRHEIGEWSQKQRKFVPLDPESLFTDEALVRPIAFKALIDQAVAETEVVKALAAKGNPEISRIREEGENKGLRRGRKEGLKQGLDKGRKRGLDEGRKQGLDEGKLNGRRETLLEQLEDQFGRVPARWKTQIQASGIDELRVWSKKLLTSQSIDDVFTSP